MLAMLSMMLAMPILMRGAMSEAGTLFKAPPRWEVTPLINYLRTKKHAPGVPLITHSRHKRVQPLQFAAVNSMSPTEIVTWDERLTQLASTQRHDAVQAALAELDELGRRSIDVAAPIRIDRPESGPPRDLFRVPAIVDPPPAPAVPADRADTDRDVLASAVTR
ncbi:hypothetical protein [Acidisoma cladoniae]|uniref:hypothetical protein n=1 Tax=Acidisoma cladoniae TaxID=3040935 RepID=UPI00254B8A83|nr:hypothetical protein [Acidisoma sp. PAMC 29798]